MVLTELRGQNVGTLRFKSKRAPMFSSQRMTLGGNGTTYSLTWLMFCRATIGDMGEYRAKRRNLPCSKSRPATAICQMVTHLFCTPQMLQDTYDTTQLGPLVLGAIAMLGQPYPPEEEAMVGSSYIGAARLAAQETS